MLALCIKSARRQPSRYLVWRWPQWGLNAGQMQMAPTPGRPAAGVCRLHSAAHFAVGKILHARSICPAAAGQGQREGDKPAGAAGRARNAVGAPVIPVRQAYRSGRRERRWTTIFPLVKSRKIDRGHCLCRTAIASYTGTHYR